MKTFGNPPPLRLEIGDDTFRLNSSEEFELSLQARLDVRSLKHAQLRVLSDDALAEEFNGTGRMERVLVEALSSPTDDRYRIGRFLRRLNLNLITQDNDWRLIFAALAPLEDVYEAYKSVAAMQYLEYLGARKELVRSIQERRARHLVENPPARQRLASVPASSPRRRSWPEPPPVDPGPPAGEEAGAPRQTLVYDVAELCLPYTRGADLGRMAKGVAVEVSLEERQSLAVMLGVYKFLLVGGDPLRMIDDTGHDVRIHREKTIIGRGGHSNVAVDPAYTVVSRQHLIVESLAGGADPADRHLLLRHVHSRRSVASARPALSVAAQSFSS